MYKIVLNGIKNRYDYEELIKVFLNPLTYVLVCEDDENPQGDFENSLFFDFSACGDKNEQKKKMYVAFSELTGKTPEWGILTGVRPVKLAGELAARLGSFEKAKELLLSLYMLQEEKADLLLDTYRYQQQLLNKSTENLAGVYIGIPFCPTRCVYCSFTSNQAAEREIERYMEALHKEISYVSEQMKQRKILPESIYIGGGTPTTLNPELLENLLAHIREAFDCSALKEFTVEAGRPDTITAEKLELIKRYGAHRISINPQSMKEHTLELIGRAHKPDDIRKAFVMAKNAGIPFINADVIAGLPEETPLDFENTMRQIIELSAENITVHTLAVKRASRLIDIDKDYHYRQGETVKIMLEKAAELLTLAGYKPYYLYRQKHMAGSFENVGYCKTGAEGIYNIRIMEEMQTIIALGAGGISKRYYSAENRLERIPNVSNYEIYIERLEEMLERKREKLFL